MGGGRKQSRSKVHIKSKSQEESIEKTGTYFYII